MRLRTSSAAEIQALQTRAMMAGALTGRAVRALFLAWLALTLVVIWIRVGEYRPHLHHAYFSRWILCGIIAHTPLVNRLATIVTLPADGRWYQVTDLAAWLESPQLYRGNFYEWFFHIATGIGGYWGIGTWLLPVAVAAIFIVWRLQRADATDHIRGLALTTPRRWNWRVNGGLSGRVFHPAGRGIRLGTAVIPAIREPEHFLVTGSPGSGKSTLIRQMLKQIEARGQAAIVLDPEAEYVQEFYHPDRGDVILNPLDARCPFWSPWLEFRQETLPMDIEAMTASLIRDQPRTATERFFFDSGRAVLKSLFEVIADHEPNAISQFLAQPREEIHKALAGTRAYPLVDPGTKETGQSIIATAINAVAPFEYLPTSQQTERQWTTREWAHERRGWVFLSSTADAEAAIHALQGVWLDSLVRWLMSAEIGSEQVFVIADELPAVGYQPQIEKLLTRGRKRGLAVLIAFQNISQLRNIYGPDGAITLTSSPTTKVILRVDHFETAQWTSNLIGSREVERLQMNQLAGLSNYREGVTLSPRRSIEQLILPAQIQMLRPFEGYLCVAGEPTRTTITIPRLHLTKRLPAFIPRALSPTDTQPQTPTNAVELDILGQLTARAGRPQEQE